MGICFAAQAIMRLITVTLHKVVSLLTVVFCTVCVNPLAADTVLRAFISVFTVSVIEILFTFYLAD